MSTHKKRVLFIGIFILLLSITLGFLSIFPIYQYHQQKEADLAQLAQEEYNSIFCSMYSIAHFAEEDFSTYRGVSTLKLPTVLQNAGDLGNYLEAAFSSDNTLEIIYLGLDPAQIWKSSHKKIEEWNRSLTEDIISYAIRHPEVSFEILLPAPTLAYWTGMKQKEYEETLTTYESLVHTLSPYTNITTFFVGNEPWLIANEDNYTEAFTTKPSVSQKLFLYTFCDHQYQINEDNVTEQLDALKTLIAQEKESPDVSTDLSDWDVVFFGDSIIGNYTGSLSVPGVVTALSGAHTYNCAKGGIPACTDTVFPLSFPSSVDYFMAQEPSAIPVDGPFGEALAEYISQDHSDRKLCFVINFGLNDYFSGYPVSNPKDDFDTNTYAGALREGIRKLQTTYPHAEILLMTPNFVTMFQNGSETLSEEGSILTEYVDAALQVATDMKVSYLNNYVDLGINESNTSLLLADGTHLNEAGRFLLGKRIIEKMTSLSQ